VFNKLSTDDIKNITKIILKNFEKRLLDKNIKVKFKSSVIDYISNIGYDKTYGARPIKRVVQNKIEDLIVNEILDGNIKEGDSIILNYVKNNLKVEVIKK
jgi:ATP-dependent Clp protease ATP-binding subunit ClpC